MNISETNKQTKTEKPEWKKCPQSEKSFFWQNWKTHSHIEEQKLMWREIRQNQSP